MPNGRPVEQPWCHELLMTGGSLQVAGVEGIRVWKPLSAAPLDGRKAYPIGEAAIRSDSNRSRGVDELNVWWLVVGDPPPIRSTGGGS
jgi:hypothetical protein